MSLPVQERSLVVNIF